jgi:hypothetical protein
MVGSREKLGMDPWIGLPACYGLCREPFFSGAVALLNSVDDYVKEVAICGPRKIRMVEGHTWTEHVLCWPDFPLQGVHRFESP